MRPENWRTFPVWAFSDDDEGYWVDGNYLDPHTPPPDPEELFRPVVYAGFTWGEAEDAENKFLCPIPIHYGIPIPEVVQLTTLPRELWLGLPVFHPMGQRGFKDTIICNWNDYDVGVVIDVEPDPHFEDLDIWQVTFLGGCGGDGGWTLHYRADTLWIPRVLAERLSF